MNYATHSDVNNLLRQLLSKEHDATRHDLPEGDRNFRAVLADALRDVGREEEAHYLQQPGHVLVAQDGKVYPGRFSSHEIMEALNRYARRVYETNHEDAPVPIVDVHHDNATSPGPGLFMDEVDEETGRLLGSPIPFGHFRITKNDPGHYWDRVAADVPAFDAPGTLAGMIRAYDQMYGSVYPRTPETNAELTGLIDRIAASPVEFVDESRLAGADTQQPEDPA